MGKLQHADKDGAQLVSCGNALRNIVGLLKMHWVREGSDAANGAVAEMSSCLENALLRWKLCCRLDEVFPATLRRAVRRMVIYTGTMSFWQTLSKNQRMSVSQRIRLYLCT